MTIPQRLREIAVRIGTLDMAAYVQLRAIANELEAPDADAVQVVAWELRDSVGYVGIVYDSSAADAAKEDGWETVPLIRRRDHIATVAALQEETESLRRQLADLADRQQYNGNSVSFIYQKKDAYASAIDKVFDVLGKHGHKADGSTHVADLTDKALCALQERINALEARQVPEGEVHFIQGGKLVGKIINIGSQQDTSKEQP